MTDTVKMDQCPTCGAPIPAEAPQGLCPKCVLFGAATATEVEMPDNPTAEIPSVDRVAAAFPQLEVMQLIGRGGMGFVFKARQPHLDRLVALKLLPEKLAKDPRFAERFNREGRVLARLNHPNIVAVYDFGVTAQFCFLMMEFVDGVNLRDAMQAGRFSPGEALSIVPKICEALQYAHQNGVLHRDIKPANILLDARGQVKLADFGIAKLVGSEKPDVTLTGTGATLGTAHYMAPEQLEKPSAVDHRADIYSLGVVFYEMLTGELPIGRFAPPSSKTPVGTDVDQVVFRTLEKDRERRYQSAGELKTQVEHLTDPGAKETQPVPRVANAEGNIETPKWSHKAIWTAALTGLSLPLPLILAAVLITKGGGLGIWELMLGLGTICLLGVPGTLLGWVALNDIRVHRGRLSGLPFAVFGALAWPILILMTATIAIPWLGDVRSPNAPDRPFAASLLLLMSAAGTLTFAIWTCYATTHWARNESAARRGHLKWIFACLLLAGVGALPRTEHWTTIFPTTQPSPSPLIGNEPRPAQTVPAIQFTFTAVELRNEAGARWLTMDFIEQTQGDCERVFPWNSQVPGWICEVRVSSFLLDSDTRFPPVSGQRVSWKLPEALDLAAATAFRDHVAQQWVQKPVAIPAESEQTLFVLGLPDDGGTLTARIGVKLLEEPR